MSGDLDTIEQALTKWSKQYPSDWIEEPREALAALARVRAALEARLGEPGEDERQLRDLLNLYVPAGFRDDDGVWRDGPHRATANATLDRILAGRERAEKALRRIAEPSAEYQAHKAAMKAGMGMRPLLPFEIARAALSQEGTQE